MSAQTEQTENELRLQEDISVMQQTIKNLHALLKDKTAKGIQQEKTIQSQQHMIEDLRQTNLELQSNLNLIEIDLDELKQQQTIASPFSSPDVKPEETERSMREEEKSENSINTEVEEFDSQAASSCKKQSNAELEAESQSSNLDELDQEVIDLFN